MVTGLIPLQGSPNPSCLVLFSQEHNHPRRQVHLLTNLRSQNCLQPHQPDDFVPLANSFSCSRALFNKTVGDVWLFSRTVQQQLIVCAHSWGRSTLTRQMRTAAVAWRLTSSCSSPRCPRKWTMETAEKSPFLGAALLQIPGNSGGHRYPMS